MCGDIMGQGVDMKYNLVANCVAELYLQCRVTLLEYIQIAPSTQWEEIRVKWCKASSRWRNDLSALWGLPEDFFTHGLLLPEDFFPRRLFFKLSSVTLYHCILHQTYSKLCIDQNVYLHLKLFPGDVHSLKKPFLRFELLVMMRTMHRCRVRLAPT